MTDKHEVASLGWTQVRLAESRYSQVARALLAEIREGVYALGDKLPTEPELQNRFGVSRHTIREALRELKDQGLIAAHPGIGTVVRARHSGVNFMHGAGNLHELIQFADATAMELVGKRQFVADGEWSSRLGAAEGERWVEASVLRRVPGEPVPIAWVLLYVRHEHRGVIDQIDTSGAPVFAMLEKAHSVAISQVSQQIVAVTLDSARATQLSAPPGAPALQITRHFFDDAKRVVLVSVGQYPSDRFSHNTSFRIRTG